MKISTRAITLAATLTALCFVTGALPYVFFLPVTVAATTLSVGMAAFVGLAFGAVSIIYCFIMPASFVAAAFIQAPYVALFPRLAAATLCALCYRAIVKLCKPEKKVSCALAAGGAAAFGSLLNTAFVVGLLTVTAKGLTLGGITLAVAVPQMLLSGAIECVCMAVLTPPVALTLNKTVLRKTSGVKGSVAANISGERGDGASQ